MLEVTFPTWNPFLLADMKNPVRRDARIQGRGVLHIPGGGDGPLPAVVVLDAPAQSDGAGYGETLRAQGFVALTVDTAWPRGLAAAPPGLRVRRLTEAMMLADAFAALRYLAAHPLVDHGSISVIGFGLGGLAAALAAFEQVSRLFMDDGVRFAGHVAYYPSSLLRVETVAATGAPVLMFVGGRDGNASLERTRHLAADLTRGGASVELQVYPAAHHGWNAAVEAQRSVRFDLAGCRLRLDGEAVTREERSDRAIRGPLSRNLALLRAMGWAGYRIRRDEAVTRDTDEAALAFVETISMALPAAPAENAPRRAAR